MLAADEQLQPAGGALITMQDGSSHRSFLALQMQRSGELQNALKAKQLLWQQVNAALQRGDVREAVRLLRDAGGEPGGGSNVGRTRPPDQQSLLIGCHAAAISALPRCSTQLPERSPPKLQTCASRPTWCAAVRSSDTPTASPWSSAARPRC